MNAGQTAKISVGQQRTTLLKEIGPAFAVAIAIWAGVWLYMPVIPGMEDLTARLVFALKLSCIAILFCLVTAIEAVAHERFQSPGIDPLTGYMTRRMETNLRYLQNTLEQLIVFIPGLFALAVMLSGDSAPRAMVAVTVVWTLSRFGFWIGYHYGALHRGVGAPGMLQSMLVLLYVCARLGFDVAGPVGAALPVVAFLCIEAFLFYATRARASAKA